MKITIEFGGEKEKEVTDKLEDLVSPENIANVVHFLSSFLKK